MMRVTVVGLGKIGLPIAMQYASRGLDVVGADIDPDVVARILRLEVPDSEEPGTLERLSDALRSGRFTAVTDTEVAVAGSDFVVVAVPLVVGMDRSPDFSIVDSATRDIARGLSPGVTIIYETTLPVGTTRHRLAPLLAGGSGLALGEDLFVCHSPERVYTGRVYSDLRRYPKLVGGVDAASASRGIAFYRRALEFDDRADLPRPNGVWDLGSSDAAELAKLAETTYRDVNIALANQFASHADALGVDVGLVIDAANSQPYSHIHQPGIAVGGHCIPVYPRLYLSTDKDAALVSVARERNERMPEYAIQRLEGHLGSLDGRRVVVLGAAYRGGVKETAFSGVFAVVDALRQRGAHAYVHDPLYTPGELEQLGLPPVGSGQTFDAAVIQSDHNEYRTLQPADLAGVQVVLDGRNCLDLDPWRAAKIPVLRIGRPDLVSADADTEQS